MKTLFGYEPVATYTRGGIIQNCHFGALAMVNADGVPAFTLGDKDLVNFPHSSLKPFQALPFVELGGPEHFGLTEEELAVMCSSHTGTDEHLRVVQSIHVKTGLSMENLQCGPHMPVDKPTADRMLINNEEPNSLHNNCSGKHSGMLAQALLRGALLDNYMEIDHPVQKAIVQTIAEMCSVEPDSLVVGIDGCTAPTFALPLYNFALGVAKLCQPDSLEPTRADACRKVTHAMMNYPNMIRGPKGMDTVLMGVMKGKVISKLGAEGHQLIGIMPNALHEGSPAYGISMKISDGDVNERVRYALVTEILRAVGFEEEMNSPEMEPFTDRSWRNWRGIQVGEISLMKPVVISI